MIKFFREIRRKLLDEGRIKRYLIYAIGEILLVMMGILLAFQVNNWNEQRKDKIVEKQVLYEKQLSHYFHPKQRDKSPGKWGDKHHCHIILTTVQRQ